MSFDGFRYHLKQLAKTCSEANLTEAIHYVRIDLGYDDLDHFWKKGSFQESESVERVLKGFKPFKMTGRGDYVE